MESVPEPGDLPRTEGCMAPRIGPLLRAAMAGFGASSSLQDAPAKVGPPSQNRRVQKSKISASPESPLNNRRLPALVWKIHLLHGAQTRLVQNAAIAGHAPGTLSRLSTERIQGHCAALLKITQEIPISLQPCHGGQRGKPGRGGPGILLRL